MTITKKLIGRLPILLGEYDSTKAYSKRQRVTLYGSEFESIVDNNTVAPATLSNGTLTINTDSWRIVSNGTEAFLAGEKVKQFNIDENVEFVDRKTDTDGRLLETTNTEGKKTFYSDLDVKDNLNVKGNLDVKGKAIVGDLAINQSDISDILDGKVDKDNNKSLVDNNIVKSISISDNPEYTDLKTDSEGRILSYRDYTGKLHEAVGVKTPSIDTGNINVKQLNADKINYSDSNVSDLMKAIKGNGIRFDAADWSNYISNDGDNPLCLLEPYRAYINFITNDGSERLGTIDGQKAVMEFYDGYGNYFKKNVSIDQQGDSSKAQWKRNMSIDMFDSEQGGDAFAVKFGNWVAQDSYHLKAYYEDIIRGVNVINYKLCDRIARDRGVLADRPYKEYINPKQNDAGSNNHDNDILNDARTISDGFPVIVYLNGDFYGAFVMQLKKHRDNFNMDRNATDNIHLDGYLAGSDFWNGNVNWHRFEIRNPKPKSKKWTLLCQDGSTYNGDNAQEIMGTDSSKYDASNTSCVKSAELKANIVAVSKYMSDIKVFEDAYTASNTEENLSKVKTEIEKRFGVSQMIDLVIALNICGDGDITKNVQWVTWGKINDTLKMFPCPWDMDGTYGVNSTHGFAIGGIGSNTMGNIDNYPLKYVYKYYMTDLKTRYKELRDNNVISPRISQNMVMDWVHRIGDNNYELEYKKWDESPCHRDFGASNAWKRTAWTGIDRRPSSVTNYSERDSYSSTTTYAKDEFVKVNHVLYQSLQDNNQGHDVTETTWWEVVSWQDGKTYNKGDMVYDGVDTFYLFTAQENTTERPFKTLYKHYPKEGGNYDSALRICKWIEDKFVSLDKEMEYKQ